MLFIEDTDIYGAFHIFVIEVYENCANRRISKYDLLHSEGIVGGLTLFKHFFGDETLKHFRRSLALKHFLKHSEAFASFLTKYHLL